MSDDNTSFDKDPNRKPKKKSGSGHSDLKTQPPVKKGSKDYQVYFEPKSGEKPSKEHFSANKANPPYEGQGDNNGRNVRQDKPKSHRNPRKESRDQTPGTLRRKYPRVPKKYILELYQKTTISRDIEHLLSISNQLFVREKQDPANEESFDLDPNDGLLANPPKPSYSSSATTSHTNSTATSITTTATSHTGANTANTNTGNSSTVPASSGSTSNNATGSTTPSKKPMEMFDFAQQKMDPIQAMREKMKGKPAAKPAEDIKKPEDNGIKRSNIVSVKEEVKAPEPEKPKVEEKAPTKEQDDGERYSDVDAEFERKVQNNEIVEPQENDLEDDFLDERSKESFARMDDRSRPEWENVDSNQVVQQREDFQTGLPQDKRTIFGDRYIESRGETDSQRSRTDRSDGSRHIARDSGDFSKVSFENDRSNLSDEFNMQQGEYYGATSGMRANPQQQYAGMGYNPSEGNQNMYRGQQQQMQPQPQYGNKGYMGAQQGVTKQGSQTHIQQSQSPVPKSTSSGTPPDFIFKYFSPDYDAKVWSYVDLEQKTQGPYSGRTMDEWYSKGYLPLELHVTIGKSNGYRTLKELAEVIINHTTQAQAQTQPQAQPQVQTAQSRAPQQYQQGQQNYGQQYQQYQQYQQQQQHQQYQQQQPQNPQHSQYTQQQQQQYYQQQQQQPQYQAQSGGYGGQGGQGQGAQSYLANKNKAYNQNEEAYYGQQSPSVQQKQQYMSYGGKTVQEINPQEYYGSYGSTSAGSYYSGSGQEGQQNVNPNYGFKASPTTSLNTSGYYQEQGQGQSQGQGQGQGGAYRTPTNQIGYSQPQPQKQQQYNKAGYQQGSMQNYSGVSPISANTGYGQSMSPGFSGQGNVREYGNSGSGSGSYGGQGGSGNAMYMMQHQQQMGNKGQVQNQGYPVEMSAHLKNMLGMMRPPSQQGDHPDLQ